MNPNIVENVSRIEAEADKLVEKARRQAERACRAPGKVPA